MFESESWGMFTPVNILLSIVVVWLVRKLLTPSTDYSQTQVLDEISTPVITRRDYTLEDLKPFNGVDNRTILVAINGKVFDVSSKRNFYGPGGPYALFAGRDASRALAKADLTGETLPTEWDELDDLTASERDQLREWEESFEMKYNIVGTLVKEYPQVPEAAKNSTLEAPRPTSPTLSTGSAAWEMVDANESETEH